MSNQVDAKMFHSSHHWESAWEEARYNSVFRGADKNSVNHWNKRAENFSKNTTGKQGEKRVEKILGWLEQEGVELAGAQVLDIGAGPGSFAIPMARRAKEVVAIEPSEQMVNIMKDYAEGEKLTNLQVIMEPWEENFDIEQRGFKGQFDLVFSSMNPGVSNWTTLEKLLQCATKYCYISTFAGKRDNPALQHLWQQIYNEPMPPWPGEIFYIANLLYIRGFQFSFKVWEETSVEKMTVDEAATFLADMLGRFSSKDSKEFWKQSYEYVASKAVDELFSQNVTSRIGKILVRL